jgi:signal transduction histidine kinase/sugar lactone lactonase YvrE
MERLSHSNGSGIRAAGIYLEFSLYFRAMIRRALRISLVLATVLLHPFLFSQLLPLRVFSAKDGLTGGDPLLVDHWGFVWFGSEEGLTAYDGTEFTFFGKAHGLLDNVNDAAEDSDGTIWIGGHNGITKASRSASFPLGLRFTSYSTHNGKAVGEIKLVAQSPDGAIFFSGQVGMYEVREGTLKQLVVMEQPLETNAPFHQFEFSEKYHINNILFDHTGALWLTARHSLYRCENNWRSGARDTLFLHEVVPVEGLFSEWIGAAFFDDHDRLWFSTMSGSLFVVEQTLRAHRIETSQLTIRNVNGLLYDGERTLWIGDGDRLHTATINHDARTGMTSLQLVQTITTQNGIPTGSLMTRMLKDRDGNLWANAIWGGVIRISMKGFVALEAPLLGLSSIHKVVNGPANRLWITSQSRVFSIPASAGDTPSARGHPIQRETERFLSRPVIEFIRIGPDTLIVTDESGKISWLNCSLPEPTLQRFHVEFKDPRGNVLLQPNVWIVKAFNDRSGNLWLSANLFGIFKCRIRGDTLVVLNMFSLNDGLPDHGVRAIAQTRDGALWFGGFDGGLARFDGTSFRKFTTEDGLSDNYIRSLHETPDGTLWIGTRYNGLCAYQDGIFYRYPSYDALQCTSVWSITGDETGRLWLATGQGLKSFVPDPLFQSEPLVRGYDESDGIPNEAAFNLFIDDKMNLYVTTRKGLYILSHQFMNAVSSHPATYIRSVAVNGKEVSSANVLELSPSDQTLTISFGAVEFSQRGSALFQYMLEGLTSQWSVPTSFRNVTFAKLPPGDYLFKVRSVPNFQIVETQTAMARELFLSEQSMRVTVATPFWRSWWFIGLIITVLALGSSMVYNYRVEQLLTVERLRGRIATDLHDDIGSSLTRIALFSDVVLCEVSKFGRKNGVVKKQIERLSTLVDEIGTTSRDLIDTMNDIVWSVDPKKDSFEDLALHMKTYASRILEAQQIDYEIDIPSDLSLVRLPVEFRRNVFLIFKEALNNIVRHSKARNVMLTVQQSGGSLMMRLVDDGRGFSTEQVARGNGIHNMKQRAAACRGTVDFSQRENKGTIVTAFLKLP